MFLKLSFFSLSVKQTRSIQTNQTSALLASLLTHKLGAVSAMNHLDELLHKVLEFFLTLPKESILDISNQHLCFVIIQCEIRAMMPLMHLHIFFNS